MFYTVLRSITKVCQEALFIIIEHHLTVITQRVNIIYFNKMLQEKCHSKFDYYEHLSVMCQS